MMKMCIYNVYHVTGNYIIASMIMVTMVVLAVSSCFENNDYIKTCRNPIHRCSWRWSKVVQGVPVYLNSFFKEPYSSFIRQTSCFQVMLLQNCHPYKSGRSKLGKL